jgi:hypothetical protein
VFATLPKGCKPSTMSDANSHGPYSVRQTDCRTGWQVVRTSTGRPVETYRRREIAAESASAMNAAIAAGAVRTFSASVALDGEDVDR